VTTKDFWACWHVLHAEGWYHFSWGAHPSLVPISLHYHWYTKQDLIGFFFHSFFGAQTQSDVIDPDFIFNCTMDLLDEMRPFNDVFADAFLCFSGQDWIRIVRSLTDRYNQNSCHISLSKKSYILMALLTVWPLSLGEGYKKISKRLISIIKSIKVYIKFIKIH